MMTKKGMLLLSLLYVASCVSGPPAPYMELKIVHQIQPWTDWMLQDERHGWMGNNPRVHVEFGLEFDRNIDCAFVTGTSLFVGAPLKSNGPELYWANLECGKRWGGRY